MVRGGTELLRLSGGQREFLDAHVVGCLPVAEGAAEQGCGATLTAEDDHFVVQGELGVPGDELDAVVGHFCEDPVIACLLLHSANACEQMGRCHISLSLNQAKLCNSASRYCNALHRSNSDASWQMM